MRRESLRRALAAGCLAGCLWLLQSWLFAATSAAASPQSFDLQDHGRLTLAIPAGWTSELKRSANQLPPTLRLTAGAGAGAAEVLITPVWPLPPANVTMDEATLRAKVSEAAKQTESRSTEGTLVIREISNTGGRGFYYAATDRAPKPGEYRYLTQGMIPVNDIALAFTVLSNDKDGATARAALDLLKSARHRPGAAKSP